MGWTSRADVDRYFALADPTYDLTPKNADQSAAVRKLREAEWAAQAAIMHHGLGSSGGA